MKKRPEGFISEEFISHYSEQFDYIRELHKYLWDFVYTVIPDANGNLSNFVDTALTVLQKRSMNETTVIPDTNWDELKHSGSEHYKTGDTEPIDLYKAGDCFHDFAICSIIKYAYRNRKDLVGTNLNMEDLDKIIHCAKLLKALYIEEPFDGKEFIEGSPEEYLGCNERVDCMKGEQK